MKIIPLSNEEAVRSGFTHKVVVAAADVIAAGSGTALELFPVAPGDAVRLAGVRVTTPFVTNTADLVALTVGDGDDTDRFVAQIGVQASQTPNPRTLYYMEGAISSRHVYAAADTVDAIFTLTVENPPDPPDPVAASDITAGEVEILLAVHNLKRLGDGRNG
jgi:hypothetical protein